MDKKEVIFVLLNEFADWKGAFIASNLNGGPEPGKAKYVVWTIDFYLKNGFRQVSQEEKNILLRTYWNIPERQVEASVVLSNKDKNLTPIS